MPSQIRCREIRRHIVQITILFGPQAFPNGVLIGKSIAVIHLIPITIFLIGHLKLEGAVVVYRYCDKVFCHGADIVHQLLRGGVFVSEELFFHGVQAMPSCIDCKRWAH